MIDLHFDLLTKLYMCYLENDFSFVEKWVSYYHPNNVKGLIANLCFMSPEEMKAEYHPNYFRDEVLVCKMFEIASTLLAKYMPNDIEVLLEIEGCDYVTLEQLETLKVLGLHIIAPVWNEPNQYGSGNRGDYGLTESGKAFVSKAIELGLGIDLSHANEKTFYDILALIREYRDQGYDPVVFVSHSNSKAVADVPRNLMDDQLLALQSVEGIIGLISHRNFTYKDAYDLHISDEVVKATYVDHFLHVSQLFGGIENIAVSTDDMTFDAFANPRYAAMPIFPYDSIKSELEQLLYPAYREKTADILSRNAEKMFQKIRKKEGKIL